MATVYDAKDNSPIVFEQLPGISMIVSLPAAFSGTCTQQCVPDILQHANEIKSAGVQKIIIVVSDQSHAIREWVLYSKWSDSPVTFASDFGKFEMRQLVGKVSDEVGKKDYPPPTGMLLRRSYHLLKEGKPLWHFVEPDTSKYTLKIQDVIDQITKAQ